MKVEVITEDTKFKSGYPTFQTNGHLSYIPDKYDLIFMGNRYIEKKGLQRKLEYKLDYLA